MVASVAMIAVATLALYLGGLAFWLLTVVIALLMMDEWGDLLDLPRDRKRLAQYALSVPLAIMAPIAAGPGAFALGLLAGAAFFVVIVTRNRMLAAGVLYCGLPVFSLLLIDVQTQGLMFTLWAMALVWASDIGAFFAGRTIGGPKLAPRLSPNKTWAGLIGGVVLSSVLAAGMHWYFGLPWRLTLATPVLAVLSQGGDLFESWMKRRAGVKDSGNILPGHGGVLDRLDGVVPVAPVAALLVILPALIG
ncbi:phosphatidate cytidylyltransferase [Sphingomonas sp. Leaf17]|uniref:phosphatidate cytidylyltransferase n=1 Tax=Sphingomonas sp. Leaf17 TaxID=1735683 RepID=UPI0006F53D6E|nr:phosphatidate cytidylyltransferase [Sphingomonas sp. Leaf17]KQM65759.1 phosphatidate cytidylyltransferase [Sphingomonas sp. Leaf17]